MPRKKKTEEVQVTCFDIEAEKKARKKEKVEAKPIDYGTGWNRVNNMLQAGFSIEEIRGEKNE